MLPIVFIVASDCLRLDNNYMVRSLSEDSRQQQHLQ